jgi:hypothetical protein
MVLGTALRVLQQWVQKPCSALEACIEQRQNFVEK